MKKEILKLLKKEGIKADETLIEVPPDPGMGDYAFPCFMLAKEMKKSPQKIAEELAKKIKPDNNISKTEAKGPYLNFFVNRSNIADDVLGKIRKEGYDYGSIKQKKPKKIMVEFPSPNTNKPLHLGHVRNMLIGESISRISGFLGKKVIRANLNNDRGIHICKSMLAYQRWGNKKDPDTKTDHFVGKFYVLFNEKSKEKPHLELEAQEMLKKWEDGDKETIKLWKLMNAWAYGGFEETYEKLHINFDKYYYESEFYGKAKKIVDEGLKKKIFYRDEEGAAAVDLGKELGKKVLLRADGTSIYITQDLYLAKLKFEEYRLDESIYVVGNEQNYHFKVLFRLLEMLGYEWSKRCHHLSYGMVYLPSGKMKSREGTVVDADEIIDNMKDLAAVEVRKRYPDLNDDETKKRAEIIGLGALKFFMLKNDPYKDMFFNPAESISFEGETGPYVQYAHARICSILHKLQDKKNKNMKADYSLLIDRHEVELVKMLQNFPAVLADAEKNLKPSEIAHYLTALSQKFNEFYHNCPVISAKDELKAARIALCGAVKTILGQGLFLLGIQAPEEM